MSSSTGDDPYIFHQLRCSMEDTMKNHPSHRVLEDSSIVIPTDKVAEVIDEFSKYNPNLALAAIECADLLQSAEPSQMFDTSTNDVGADALLRLSLSAFMSKPPYLLGSSLNTGGCCHGSEKCMHTIRLLMDELHGNIQDFHARFHPLAKEACTFYLLSETEGLHTLVKDMNTKMASAVLATDECRKEMDDLRNIIQGISDEGQTLRKLVMDVKSSHSEGLENLEYTVADLDTRFSDYKDASQKSIHRKSELFRQFHSSVRRTLAFEAEVQTKLNLRLTDLEKRVSKVQNSQGVHGQILRMSAKELGILRSELESSRHDSTHELQQACGSFWRAMVNEMEDIRNGVINEMKDILPRTGNDLRDEIVGSDELQPPDRALLSVGTPARQQLHHGVYLIHGHSFLQNVGDNFRTLALKLLVSPQLLIVNR
ncbi:hypothetical protein BD769DRAFT_1666928 [Suillus cothurnatus]|nr:hypothetical protein BD769DRAFT_1666928 [Suillus cothurnatus]